MHPHFAMSRNGNLVPEIVISPHQLDFVGRIQCNRSRSVKADQRFPSECCGGNPGALLLLTLDAASPPRWYGLDAKDALLRSIDNDAAAVAQRHFHHCAVTASHELNGNGNAAIGAGSHAHCTIEYAGCLRFWRHNGVR